MMLFLVFLSNYLFGGNYNLRKMKKNPINISVLINIYLIKFIRFDLNKVAENNKPNLI